MFKLMKDESCFKKELRADLIEMHFKDNKASFLKVIKSIIETELDDFIKIEMIEKYRANGTATYTKIMVLPAGLRDIQMQEDGRYKQSEINDLYRKVIKALHPDIHQRRQLLCGQCYTRHIPLLEQENQILPTQ